MDKSILKKAIIEKGIEKQASLIEDFRLRIEEMKSSEELLGETQFDAQQASFNEEINERADLLQGQLNFVEEEMNLLNRLNVDAPLHNSVHMGSVVVTDQRTFFVSVSLEEFEANGGKIFGISTKAPIYQNMVGKGIGDSFEFNGKPYKILDIY